MMLEGINISHYRKGAEAIINQLFKLCGGINSKLILNLCETRIRSNSKDSNTLSNILQQYGDSVNEGEGFGYIGLEWKGPFTMNNIILQHIKRIQLLIGKQPSLIYGVVPHINYGYVGLENVLYIFPFNEISNKKFMNSVSETIFELDDEKKVRNGSPLNNLAYVNETNDENILRLTFPFSIKTLTGTFPRFGIFSKDVEYLLCVITEKSIHLLALKLDKDKLIGGIKVDSNSTSKEELKINKEINNMCENMNFLESEDTLIIKGAGLIKIPIMRIGNKDISMLQCSLPKLNSSSKFHSLNGTIDGRFFFLEENSSNIYEFVYQSKEGWITPYCYVHSHQLYSSLLKELFLKYTVLRFMPRTFSFKKISIAPCGYMAILDSYQNIYIVTYLNDINSKGIFSLLAPWGRVVNSLEKWFSNIEIKSFTLPSDWDDYVTYDHDEKKYNNNEEFNYKNFNSDFVLNKDSSNFSRPSSFRIIATLKKKEFDEILSKIPGQIIKDKGANNFENKISNIMLSFNCDYNLTLSLFMDNGTRLQFQCSKMVSEEAPFIENVVNGFKDVNVNLNSPKKRIVQTSKDTLHNKVVSKDDLIFGFWLTFVLPLPRLDNKEMSIKNSYYKNGLTILTRSNTPSLMKNINANTDFSKISNKNVCQVELRLFNSLPADINMSSGPSINGIIDDNNLSVNLRYNSNSSLTLSDLNSSLNGEPIIIELDEQIESIHEIFVNNNDKKMLLEEFPVFHNSENLISPHVILEYSGNSCGVNKKHELLGWVNDRHIVFIGETRYFFLVLRWNGLQKIIGASGLFMQLMQNSSLNNRSSKNFKRLVHPEDSFLTGDCLLLTSPWIEALSGALAFDLKCILELPLFFKVDEYYDLIMNSSSLEICLSKLQGLMNILLRSQNIIGNEFFNSDSLPNNFLNIRKSINDILLEEFNKDYNSQLKQSTTFIIKSITYIVNILLQLVRFLILFVSSPNEIKKLTFKFFDKHNQNILTEVPLIFLIVSNRGISQIKLFIESFSLSTLETISNYKNLNINANFIFQIKLIYRKINWLLNQKSSNILKRLSLFSDICIDLNGILDSKVKNKVLTIEKITSKSHPIGGFLFPPHKYWEIFQFDPEQNEFFKEIFLCLSLKPFNKITDSTLLLLDMVSYFEFLTTEQIKIKHEYLDTDIQRNSVLQDYDHYFTHIEQIVKAWTISLRETFFELMSNCSDNKVFSLKSVFIKISSQAIETLFSSCSNIKLIRICIKYFFQDILTLIIEEYSKILNKNDSCICKALFEDFQQTMRYNYGNIKTDDLKRPLLILINEIFEKSIELNNTRKNWKNSLHKDFYEFLSEFIIQSNYTPYYFVLATLYLFDHQILPLKNIHCASILTSLSLDNHVNCGVYCSNIEIRIEVLKLLKEICFSSDYSNSTEINAIKYFPQLFNEKNFGNIRYQMESSIENAINNANLIISCSMNLQIPFLNYIKTLFSNNYNSQNLNHSNQLFYIHENTSQNYISFEQILYSLSKNIYSSSEIFSIINCCKDIEPFLIISTLFEMNIKKLHTEKDSETISGLISDILLQILFPPRKHAIYSHFYNDNEAIIFPILTYFFGFNAKNNYSESIQQLFEFIQKPLLSIVGSTFLASLITLPDNYLKPNLSNQEVIQKYDLFQQIYAITAILEFGNFYLINITSEKNQFSTSISIKLWNKYWSIPYDLLLDIYLSLLESCLTSNKSSNTYQLIIDRINLLDSPINNSEFISNHNDLFILHIRRCITGIILHWLDDKKYKSFTSNQSIMIKNFIHNSMNQLQFETNQIQPQNFIQVLQSIQLQL